MEALIFHGPRSVAYGEAPDPALRPGHMRLRVAACGICGTDLHVYKGMPASWPVPGIRGHEIAGVVESTGEDVEGFVVGDRVVVQPLVFCGRCPACARGETNLCSNMYLIGGEEPGGFAGLVTVPARSLFHVPNGLSLAHAALTETLATPVHALASHFHGFVRSVAVLGAGTQGLLALQLARHLGARDLIISDVVPHRLALAEKLGATRVVDARNEDPVAVAKEISGGAGVDLVIEAAGISASRQQTVAMLRAGGTGVFLALGAQTSGLDFMMVVPRELHLHGTQCYTNADFATAIGLLAEGVIDADAMVTARPLAEGPSTFETLATDPGALVKVVLEPETAA